MLHPMSEALLNPVVQIAKRWSEMRQLLPFTEGQVGLTVVWCVCLENLRNHVPETSFEAVMRKALWFASGLVAVVGAAHASEDWVCTFPTNQVKTADWFLDGKDLVVSDPYPFTYTIILDNELAVVAVSPYAAVAQRQDTGERHTSMGVNAVILYRKTGVAVEGGVGISDPPQTNEPNSKGICRPTKSDRAAGKP